MILLDTVTTEQVPGLEALCTCSGEVGLAVGTPENLQLLLHQLPVIENPAK